MGDTRTIVIHSKGKNLNTSDHHCNCGFNTAMELPCRHIFSFCNYAKLDVFEPTLCAKRWTRNYYKSSHRVFISNAHKFVDVKVSTVDSLPTKKVLSQHDKYRKVFTISQKLANLASYISTREFSYAVECLENIVKAWEQGKRVTVQVVDASSDVVEQDDNDLTNTDESLTNFADLEDSTSASFSAIATDAPCDNGWDSESSLMDYDHSCVNDTSVADCNMISHNYSSLHFVNNPNDHSHAEKDSNDHSHVKKDSSNRVDVKKDSDNHGRVKVNPDDHSHVKKESSNRRHAKKDSSNHVDVKKDTGDHGRVKVNPNDHSHVKKESSNHRHAKKDSSNCVDVKEDSDDHGHIKMNPDDYSHAEEDSNDHSHVKKDSSNRVDVKKDSGSHGRVKMNPNDLIITLVSRRTLVIV